MANESDACPPYPEPTKRSSLRYCFSRKHHGGSPHDAQWLPDMSKDVEFSVFELADQHEIADEKNHLYGVLKETSDSEIQELGTRNELIAKFPAAWPGEHRHGYPCHPLGRESNRVEPPKSIFERMEFVGLITKRQMNRLMKGDPI